MGKPKGNTNSSRKAGAEVSVGVLTRSMVIKKTKFSVEGGDNGGHLQLRSRRLGRNVIPLVKKQKKVNSLRLRKELEKLPVDENNRIAVQGDEAAVQFCFNSASTSGILVGSQDNSGAPTSGIGQVTIQFIPTAQEFEELFGETEEKKIKEFIEKYNFDPINDMPLKGRYKWTKLKP